MIGSLVLLLGYSVTVAAPDGEDFGCPSPRQVTAALEARAPGTVAPSDAAARPGLLRLVVAGGETGAAAVLPAPLQLDLLDDRGESRLRRLLPAESQRAASDCVALADTVALIVERYLHEIAAPNAASTAAANVTTTTELAAGMKTRLAALVAAGWRTGDPEGRPEAAVGLDVLGRAGRVTGGLTLSGGLAASQTARWDTGRATLRRFALRLGLFASRPMGAGRIEPGVALRGDLLRVSRAAAGDDVLHRVSPAFELSLGYRWPLAARFFVRPTLTAGIAVPYQFAIRYEGAESPRSVLVTPRYSILGALEVGAYFR